MNQVLYTNIKEYLKTLDCLKFTWRIKRIKIRKYGFICRDTICFVAIPSLNFPVTVTQSRAPDRIRIVAGWRFIDWGSSVCPTLSSANIVHRLALGITDLLPRQQYSALQRGLFEQDLVSKSSSFHQKRITRWEYFNFYFSNVKKYFEDVFLFFIWGIFLLFGIR